MRKYRCPTCEMSLTWDEWGKWTANEDSGAVLVKRVQESLIEEMYVRCDCGTEIKFQRDLICRDCSFGVLNGPGSRAAGTLVYKCTLNKSPDGKCFEERIQ